MPKSTQDRSLRHPSTGEAPGVSKMLSGGTMKHLSDEDAVNFVNHVMSAEEQIETQVHLESGCKRCTEAVAIWQRVREASSAEAEFQPPAGVVPVWR